MFSPAVTAPATPTPVEEIAAALEHIGPLHGLPLKTACGSRATARKSCQRRRRSLRRRRSGRAHGLILKGEIHVRRQHGGPMALFIGRTGQMTGVLPFSRMKTYGGQGFAISPVWALLIPTLAFSRDAAGHSLHGAAGGLHAARPRARSHPHRAAGRKAHRSGPTGRQSGPRTQQSRLRRAARRRQPASAALRANRANRLKLVNLASPKSRFWPSKPGKRRSSAVSRQPLDTQQEPNALAFIAREESIRAWLSAIGCPDAWEMRRATGRARRHRRRPRRAAQLLGETETCISLQFFARYLRSSRAAETIVNSTARIFDLIDAVKDYSNMDRAPILEVDVPAGLDATLQMLRSRMEHVEIERDYEPDLPRISAYGGELNQVWTALIENALDALGNQGRLRVACRLEGEMLLVEIWDTGPGIPPELQERIFEPFFTTKAPGQGLGLGLDNAMRIVRKHRGHLSVKSEPGSTCFRVRLPLDQLQAY